MQTFIAFVSIVLLNSSLSAVQPDVKSILRDAAARYREAKTFHLEWETTITVSSPYSSSWSKQTYVVAADEHRYHWEGRGSGLRGLRINDGQNDWFYRASVHEYSVAQSNSATEPSPRARGVAGGSTEGWIKSSMQGLFHLDDDADAAEMQRSEVLTIANTKVQCYVVRASRSISLRQGVTSTKDDTYWIETKTGLVRKAILATNGPMTTDDDMDGQIRTIEITYTRSDLGTALDPALFNFTPPADAYLIDDARKPISKPVTIGNASPPLKFKDKSGVAFDLSDLKGKVALVHFWASWCGACLEEMKALRQLPQSYADKGLVIVAVDEDEVPERGDSYFSSQKYEWRNLHDAGETNRRTWGAAGYPFLAIVDRDGNVAWTNMGAGKGFWDMLTSQLNKPELAFAP
jgi:thiol-disulfide isomerase/thioredoxin/outer membrane lipoprotein-sorting protein